MEQSRVKLDRFYDSEMLRLRGDLRKKAGASDEEVCDIYREAAELAANQGARLLELRATVSRFEAMARSGTEDQVRPRLERLYASFDQGLDLPDLMDAKAALGLRQR